MADPKSNIPFKRFAYYCYFLNLNLNIRLANVIYNSVFVTDSYLKIPLTPIPLWGVYGMSLG